MDNNNPDDDMETILASSVDAAVVVLAMYLESPIDTQVKMARIVTTCRHSKIEADVENARDQVLGWCLTGKVE